MEANKKVEQPWVPLASLGKYLVGLIKNQFSEKKNSGTLAKFRKIHQGLSFPSYYFINSARIQLKQKNENTNEVSIFPAKSKRSGGSS